MSRLPLSALIPRLVDKWSFEIIHRAKMGETQAMNTMAQIQFSRKGWGRISPNPIQARRWLEYGAGRGDGLAHQSLQNLRNVLTAREHELAIARQYGLVDYTKLDAQGRVYSPSAQVNLAPVDFSKIITHNVTNVLAATSEEEGIKQFTKANFKPLAQTLREHHQKLVSEGKPGLKLPQSGQTQRQPVDYHKIEQEQKQAKGLAAKDMSSSIQEQIRQRVKTGELSPQEGAQAIRGLQHGEATMDAKAAARIGRAEEGVDPTKPQRR